MSYGALRVSIGLARTYLTLYVAMLKFHRPTRRQGFRGCGGSRKCHIYSAVVTLSIYPAIMKIRDTRRGVLGYWDRLIRVVSFLDAVCGVTSLVRIGA